MTAAGARWPLLAFSFALAAASGVPALLELWFALRPEAPSRATVDILNSLFSLSAVYGPILWLVLTIGLLILFRKGALISLLGLPFVLAPIALMGFVLLAFSRAPPPPAEYHIVKSEILVK